MAIASNGVRRILELPFFYELSQRMVGVRKARKRFLEHYVRPFPAARIMDIGCGPGTIVDYLPLSVDYVGYDINPKYINEASRKYRGRARFFCVNISDVPVTSLSGLFDIVLAIGVLHHLDDRQADRLFECAFHQLKVGGILVTYDPVYISPQSFFARWIIGKDRGGYVRSPGGYTALAKRRFPAGELFVESDMLVIPYTHFIMRLTKSSGE